MTRRLNTCVLIALLIWTPCAAYANPAKEARQTEKIKAGILKLGVGKEARVKLKLKDNSRLSGYISAVGDESFVVTNLNAETTTVPYPAVAQVQGNNLSTRTKIIIGVSAVVAAIIILYNVRGAFCDGC